MPTRTFTHLVFWIFAALAAGSQVAILRAVLAGRAPAASRRPVARWAEVAWVVLPMVVLIIVLVATWQAMGRQPAGNPGLLTLS